VPNNNYRRGANLEREVKKYYESIGYKAARAAGSHGDADVWATNFKELVLIQCKIGADAKRCKNILQDLISGQQSLLNNSSHFPVSFSVVVGMKQGKPIVLAGTCVKGKIK
jgi:hypothetical protein